VIPTETLFVAISSVILINWLLFFDISCDLDVMITFVACSSRGSRSSESSHSRSMVDERFALVDSGCAYIIYVPMVAKATQKAKGAMDRVNCTISHILTGH
jgi:hypothetical protein